MPTTVLEMEQQERKGECQGNREKCGVEGCPKFGTLGRAGRDGKRRIRGCEDPAARGRRNRAKGDGKARRVRKQLNLGGANTRHEELWGGAVRVEIKAGAQVGPIATRFRAAEQQSGASRALGDIRPFVFVAMPDDWGSEGLAIMRLSAFADLLNGG